MWFMYLLCLRNLLRSLFLSEEYVFVHLFCFLFDADYIVVESHLVHARYNTDLFFYLRIESHLVCARFRHHQLKAAQQELQMMTRRKDTKLLIGAPGWVDNEVRKGLVEGSNRVINTLEDEEGVD